MLLKKNHCWGYNLALVLRKKLIVVDHPTLKRNRKLLCTLISDIEGYKIIITYVDEDAAVAVALVPSRPGSALE